MFDGINTIFHGAKPNFYHGIATSSTFQLQKSTAFAHWLWPPVRGALEKSAGCNTKKKQQDSNNPKQTDHDIGFLFCLYHDIA